MNTLLTAFGITGAIIVAGVGLAEISTKALDALRKYGAEPEAPTPRVASNTNQPTVK